MNVAAIKNQTLDQQNLLLLPNLWYIFIDRAYKNWEKKK